VAGRVDRRRTIPKDKLTAADIEPVTLSPELVHNSCRLCENSDAKLTNRIFAEFWAVLSDQKPTDRKRSL
jgi:hypothetical protein